MIKKILSKKLKYAIGGGLLALVATHSMAMFDLNCVDHTCGALYGSLLGPNNFCGRQVRWFKGYAARIRKFNKAVKENKSNLVHFLGAAADVNNSYLSKVEYYANNRTKENWAKICSKESKKQYMDHIRQVCIIGCGPAVSPG